MLASVIEETQRRLRAIQNNEVVPSVATGLTQLDRTLGGLGAAHLIVVAGRPGMGKTALGLNIAVHAAVQGDARPTFFFSLEMTTDELVRRIASNLHDIDQTKMRDGTLSDEDWAKWDKAMMRMKEMTLYIDDSGTLTVPEIGERIRRVCETPNLVVIDYLGLLTGPLVENRNQQIGAMTRQLKSLAKAMNCPIVLLAQLNRGPVHRRDKRPQLADLRDSGNIEQDADVVIGLYRDDKDSKNSGLAEIIVIKNRHGPTGTISVRFDEKHTTFRDADAQTRRRGSRHLRMQ